MLKDDVVVLTIHDSFIVRTGYESWLEEVMKAASKEILGASVPVESNGPRLPKHFAKDKGQRTKNKEQRTKNNLKKNQRLITKVLVAA